MSVTGKRRWRANVVDGEMSVRGKTSRGEMSAGIRRVVESPGNVRRRAGRERLRRVFCGAEQTSPGTECDRPRAFLPSAQRACLRDVK